MLVSVGADSTAKNGQKVIKNFYRQLLAGEINVSLCYCSVFEKCWVTSIKKAVQRFKNADKNIKVVQNVESCEQLEVSGI